MGRIDFEPLADRYDAGRSLPDGGTDPWRDAVLRHAPDEVARVVDVGCGTGYWLPHLSDWFLAPVVGVEPSSGMLSEAGAKVGARSITLVRGRAENLPLAPDGADALWVSNVLHHIEDLAAATRDFRRVLRPGGVVLVRTYATRLFEPADYANAVDRADLDGVFLTGGMVFDGVDDVLATYPSIDRFDERFEGAGFGRTHAEPIVHGLADTVIEFADRLALRADTTLQLIDDRDFSDGLTRLRARIDDDPVWASRPVIAPLPFLVYR